MKRFTCCLLLSAGLTAAPFAFAQSPDAALIAVLKSDAPQQQKADACIDLGRIGTKDSIAPLAALLGDEKLSHMARYGLESNPDPAVDEAFRAALVQLKGKPLAGVIQSVGARRDAKAVETLVKLLGDSDGETAAAAAASLGKIGTAPAISALKLALGKIPAAAEGLLRCAETAPKPDQAVALYDAVRAAQVPPSVKTAAARGAILARGKAGIPLLLELLKGDDAVLFGAALRAGIELPGKEATKAISEELGKLPAERQGRVAAVLAERGDAAAVPALLALARGGTPQVRVSAINALTRLGNAAAVPVLADLAGSADAEVAKAAQVALAGFSGPNVNATIIELVKKPDVKVRLMGVELIGRRRIVEAVPELLRLAGEPDPQVSGAALKVLGDIAGVKELPALLVILQKAPAPEAAAEALSSVCLRQSVCVPGSLVVRKAVYGVLPDGPSKEVSAKVAELVKSGLSVIEVSNNTFGDTAPGQPKKFRVDYTANGVAKSATVNEGTTLRLELGAGATPPEVSGPLHAAYAQAQGAPKLALLRLLCSFGGPKALDVVRAATGDANAEVKEAAMRALCDWQTAEALPDLAKMVRAAPSPKLKILALRGYIRLAAAQEVAAAEKVAALKQALAWAERDEERRLVLASLAGAPSPEALALAAASLDNANLKEDAGLAAVAIAESLTASHPDLVAGVMKKVVEVGGSEALLKRTRDCLGQIKKPDGQAK